MRAIEPWLREQVTDPRFWDGEFDKTHVGEWPLRAMTEEELSAAMDCYAAMPNPLAGKDVTVIALDN
jgi:hypothetical protein